MLQIQSINFRQDTVETICIPVCQDRKIHTDPSIVAAVDAAKKLEDFNGKKDERLVLYHLDGMKAVRAVFQGLGHYRHLDAEVLRAFSGSAVKYCTGLGLKGIVLVPPDLPKRKIEKTVMLEAIAEGACLGNYRFDKYKNERDRKPLKKICLHVMPAEKTKYRPVIRRIETICKGTCLAREWVSMPSNDKRPELFARMIVSQARKNKLNTRVLDEKILKQEKFGALLAVAKGSKSKPRMVILEYKSPAAKKTIAFVGKGVTFDSGGINLKPSTSLEDMKMDMSGAAAVAGALSSIAGLKPKLNVIGAIPIVENMPSGEATRPGDIVRSYAGKTVEIGNTDAEGRLILIDAMSYIVRQYKPQALIDLATLTGACVVALGDKIAGVFSPDDLLADAIVASGAKTFERCWRMPLPEDYKESLKSEFADINNMSSSRWGGAVTAALFLSEFVQGTRWAHIDIAGPAYAKKGSAYCDAGGTGFGVRLLCDVLPKL